MTFCLLECLRAVGLQHHYARFISVGIRRVAHLSVLTMEDYPILGICSMEDRTGLFQLIQMVKTLDLKSLEHESDDDVYSTEAGRSFTYDDCKDPDKETHDDEDRNCSTVRKQNMDSFSKPSCVCRRLDFSGENTDGHQKHFYHSVYDESGQDKGSVTAVQLDCNTNSAYSCKGKNNHKPDTHLHQSDHHMGANIKPDISGNTPIYNSHIISPQSILFHKPKLSTAVVSSEKFNNKPVKHKDRKGISKEENIFTEISCNGASEHTCKQTPVYESKRTAGYNYGLPRSPPSHPNKKQSGGQRISVCVRKRPQIHKECRRGEVDVVTTPSRESVIVHESKEAVDLTQYILQHRFYFDQVFGEESSNEEVYQRTTYPLVQHMLNGGKATCFAYGQTGSGKTHTMLGSSPRSPGLYALAVRDIFTHLSNTRMNTPLLVYVSFFEIYCGQLYDLLNHRKRLYAREDGQRVVHIAGLRDVRVDSVSSLLEVIAQGTEERTQGVSGVNPHSSRSHALLQLRLRDPNQQVAGRIWFVDLAGSERASDTKEPDRQSRMEGAEINQSLLALKECIRSLDQEQLHTPFRQSKLTQVLKDSFVGDSMTCMIANISPGHLATEHTLNTLRYADRVKELRGQGGLKGGRRGKTITSPKRSISKSSSSSRGSIRGKSPPKKPKFGRQREAFVPTMYTTRRATGGPILCSTPKNSRQDEKTSTRDRMDISLEQITPIRGFMRTGVDRKIAGGKEGRRRERYVGTDIISHSVGEQNIRESGFFHRERENQHRALKKEREGERRLIEEKRQIQSSRDSSTGVESVKERDLQKDDKRDKEKEMHLRQYHQQLQQFTPSTCLSSFSSHPASLSSSVALSELSPQHSPHLLDSELTYQGLEEVLDKYRARVNVRGDVNRGHVSVFPGGEACLQTETSQHYTKSTDEVGHGDSGGRDVKSSRAEWRPAGNEGMRGWAWVAMTEAEQAGSMTGERPAAIGAQVSYNCDSVHRREVGEEGQESSDVPAEGVWSNEEHESNDSFFTHPVVDSSNHRAPAERPLSPGCEHTNNSLTSNEPCELPFRSKHTRCSSNSLHLPSQGSKGEPSSSCSVRDPLFAADANKRGLSSTALPQEDSCSYIMDPLSISLLQVDQQSATTLFLQGGLKTSSPCQLDNEIRDGSRREMEKEHDACLDMTMRIGEEDGLSILEMPQAKTHYPPISNPITSTNIEQRQNICCTKERIGLGIMKLPIPEAMPDSLQDQEINQKPLTGISINVLANKTSAPQLKPSTCALSKQTSVIQPISSSVQTCGSKRSPNSHNVMTNGGTQIPPECSQHMPNKHPLSISITPSESVSGQMKTLPKQGQTVHSIPTDNSNNSLQPNDWTRSKFQRETSNQKTRNIINLPTLEDLDHAKWCVIQAHWKQLEEMEALWHKEGTLLCQQPDMAFSEYIHKLEEIMKRKAQCVHSMIAQLQPYLKASGSHQAHDHNQGVHDHDPTT